MATVEITLPVRTFPTTCRFDVAFVVPIPTFPIALIIRAVPLEELNCATLPLAAVLKTENTFPVAIGVPYTCKFDVGFVVPTPTRAARPDPDWYKAILLCYNILVIVESLYLQVIYRDVERCRCAKV
jgi:hypothetical protein